MVQAADGRDGAAAGGGRRDGLAPLQSLLAGGVAGMTAKSVIAPLERTKILFQASDARFRLRAVPPLLASMVRREGAAALWKGHLSTAIKVFPYAAIKFAMFDMLRGEEDLSQAQALLHGGIAAGTACICTYPLELTRSRLAVIPEHFRVQYRSEILSMWVGWLRFGGPRALFRGLVPALAGVVPYGAVAFAINDQGKMRLKQVTGRKPKTPERLALGALSGLVAQFIVYPVDVVRRRMQTEGFVDRQQFESTYMSSAYRRTRMGHAKLEHGVPVGARAVSFSDTVRQVYQRQGWRGFFKGYSMSWIKGPIVMGISFTVFDLVKAAFAS